MNQHPEGVLAIRLDGKAGGKVRASLESTRPVGAVRWFEGKSVDETLRMLPMLYRVCGTAQAAASVGAVENARGIPISPAQASAREMLIMTETLREHLLRLFTGSTRTPECKVIEVTLANIMQLPLRLRAALFPENDAFKPGGGLLSPDAEGFAAWLKQVKKLLADTVFAMPADEWRSIGDMDDLINWAHQGKCAGALAVNCIAKRNWYQAGDARNEPMPELDDDAMASRLDASESTDFTSAPDWDGIVFETGAFARMNNHPMVQSARNTWGDGLMTRTLARLAEIATLPTSLEAAFAQASAPENLGASQTSDMAPQDGGIAQVEAARGRLVHRVILDGDKIAIYRMLAPTEWNFHPNGVLIKALDRLEADTDDLEHLAALWVEAVDPCVGYDLQVNLRA